MNAQSFNTMIIEQSSSLPVHYRVGWGCVTAAFWGVWLYLWMPLVTLAAWSFGFYQAQQHLQWEHTPGELKRLLMFYAIIAAALGGALLLWAAAEYMRFRNRNRRRASRPACTQDLAQHAGLPVENLAAWQRLRCVTAYHDELGGLSGVQAVGPVEPQLRPVGLPAVQAQRAARMPLRTADSSVAG